MFIVFINQDCSSAGGVQRKIGAYQSLIEIFEQLKEIVHIDASFIALHELGLVKEFYESDFLATLCCFTILIMMIYLRQTDCMNICIKSTFARALKQQKKLKGISKCEMQGSCYENGPLV